MKNEKDLRKDISELISSFRSMLSYIEEDLNNIQIDELNRINNVLDESYLDICEAYTYRDDNDLWGEDD